MKASTLRIAASILTLALLPPAGQAAADTGNTAKEINAVLQTFLGAWARQASERELSDLLYDTSGEFALVGEGLKRPVTDAPSLLKEFTDLRGEYRPGCAITLRGPVKRSGPLAATLSTLNCPATATAKTFDYQLLMVWNRTPRGWRVVMESYTTYPVAP